MVSGFYFIPNNFGSRFLLLRLFLSPFFSSTSSVQHGDGAPSGKVDYMTLTENGHSQITKVVSLILFYPFAAQHRHNMPATIKQNKLLFMVLSIFSWLIFLWYRLTQTESSMIVYVCCITQTILARQQHKEDCLYIFGQNRILKPPLLPPTKERTGFR